MLLISVLTQDPILRTLFSDILCKQVELSHAMHAKGHRLCLFQVLSVSEANMLQLV